MAFTSAQLATEITTDPTGIGYAPFVSAGNDQGVADLLNALVAGSSVKRPDISSRELLEAVDTRDLPATMTPVMSWFESATQQTTLRLIDDAGVNTRVLGNFKRILADTNLSQTRLTALASRVGSRAEVLWGAGTVISADTVAHALRG